ncbi:hypothetical protein, partial [Neisseria sp. P0014.S006]|uniref:hypothetical protein n=1 Tax=Neisseria sp. P0014.S006 TaxID=3436752 RepID=UPI003F82360D
AYPARTFANRRTDSDPCVHFITAGRRFLLGQLLENMKTFFAQTRSNLQDETISDSINEAVAGKNHTCSSFTLIFTGFYLYQNKLFFTQ